MQLPTSSRLSRARRVRLALCLLVLVSGSACAQPAAKSSVTVLVLAGPTCPVVTDPPDPACADRPVEGAELVVTTPESVDAAYSSANDHCNG